MPERISSAGLSIEPALRMISSATISTGPSRPNDFERVNAAALELQSPDEMAGQDRQVLPRAYLGRQPRIGHSDAFAVADGQRVRCDADHLAGVVPANTGQAERCASLDERAGDGADLFARQIDGQRPALAVDAVAAEAVVLDRHEGRQQPFPAPARIAGRFDPRGEIGGVAAHVAHGVQQARSAKRAASCPRMDASGRARLRLGAVVPVIAAALQRRPGGRIPDVGIGRLAAGLDQHDLRAKYPRSAAPRAARRPIRRRRSQHRIEPSS